MAQNLLLDPVQILQGSNKQVVLDAVLILNGKITAFGDLARKLGKEKGIKIQNRSKQLLAPCLVDPHSVLEEPITGTVENLETLRKKAAYSGYGQISLLPRSSPYRDTPELLRGFNNEISDVIINLWAGFSRGGLGLELASHRDLIKGGAIGLADDDALIPISLLQKGIRLGEISNHPILVAPRDKFIQGEGLVRERVEALRGGWPVDPVTSETLALVQLLEINKQYPNISLRLMNISTKSGVEILKNSSIKPISTVNWWHLFKDSSILTPEEIGWRVTPSIGNHLDREALIEGIIDNQITAVAVNSIALSPEEAQLPPNQKEAGISGYQLVLPCLWQELIVKRGMKIERLWDALSFGPSRLLAKKEEVLSLDSNRWLLFDPSAKWTKRAVIEKALGITVGNEPLDNEEIQGKVIECGLRG